MDPSPESPSDGGLGIFVAHQAMYRRVVHQDFHEYVSAASRLWEIIFIGFLISPP